MLSSVGSASALEQTTNKGEVTPPQPGLIDGAVLMRRPSDLDDPRLSLGYGGQWTNEELAASMEFQGFGDAAQQM